MFSKLFGKKKEPEYIVVNVNARVQPLHRGEIYEDPLDKIIQEMDIGTVTGGGTLLSKSGEIENCDIEIEVHSSCQDTIDKLKKAIVQIGIPKGSTINIEKTGEKIEVGNKEGLAIYLNGSDLEPEVYESSDINFVIEEVTKLINGLGSIESHWEGSTETALYLYGNSFDELSKSIGDFIADYPLCQKCRVVQIA
jgi:hypothetical protein